MAIYRFPTRAGNTSLTVLSTNTPPTILQRTKLFQRINGYKVPETLSVGIHTVQGLYNDVVFIEVLLKLGGFARDLFLVVPHGVESLDDHLLGLLILHDECLDGSDPL